LTYSQIVILILEGLVSEFKGHYQGAGVFREKEPNPQIHPIRIFGTSGGDNSRNESEQNATVKTKHNLSSPFECEN